MKDKRTNLYEATEFDNIRDVLNNAVKKYPNNNAFIIKEVIDKKIEYNEINGKDIFKKDDKTYYVLFYKKDGNKNKYYTYINKYLNNNIKVYYVNMNDSKNDYLKHQNDLNFIIEKDRFIKVKNKEYEYYVDGKNNILNEMNTYTSKLEQKK